MLNVFKTRFFKRENARLELQTGLLKKELTQTQASVTRLRKAVVIAEYKMRQSVGELEDSRAVSLGTQTCLASLSRHRCRLKVTKLDNGVDRLVRFPNKREGDWLRWADVEKTLTQWPYSE